MSPLVMANHSAIPGVGSYNEGSDSDDESQQEPTLSVEEQLEKLTDWNKMACLLCRYFFGVSFIVRHHVKRMSKCLVPYIYMYDIAVS